MASIAAVAQRSASTALRSSILPGLLLLMAFLARLVPVVRGGGLRGIVAYDDGVYFGAANALLSGRMPYRDFLLLHPPGVLPVLAPFAALGRLTSDSFGLAVARLAFMAVGAVSAVLVYAVARRAGRVAAVAAGTMYAIWGPAAYAERTTLLEPLVNIGVLTALLLLGDARVTPRRRLLLAGAVLGVAMAVKLWAVVPLVVLGVWLIHRMGRRAGVMFLSASALAASAVCLPFFWVAPGPMLRMVVFDQLGRPHNGVSTWQRLAGMVGHYHAASGRPVATLVAFTVVAAALVIAAAVVVAATPQLRVWVGLLVVQSAVLLVGPAYYDHYATFVAPALCLVVGSAVGIVVTRLDLHLRRPLPVVAAACVALALVATVGPLQRSGRHLPAVRISEVIAGARCVRADSSAALIESNLLTRDLRRGCPLAVDVTGTAYDLSPSQLPDGRPSHGRRADPVWQQFLGSYLTGADAAIVVQARADGFGPDLLALLGSQPVLLQEKHVTVYRTTGRR